MHPTGIGIGYYPRYHDLILSFRERIQYLEIPPEGFFKNRNAAKLLQIQAHFALSLHGRSLNFASSMPFDAEYVENFLNVVEKTDPFLVSDHMSLFAEGDSDIDLYIPPVYTQENAKRLAAKAQVLKENLPHRRMAMENVPAFLFSKFNKMGEGEFFECFCEESGVGVILNLDSIFVSACLNQMDPIDLIRSYPAQWVYSITYMPPAAMNKVICKQFGAPFHRRVQDAVKAALEHCECKNILLQFGHFDGKSEDMQFALDDLEEMVEAYGRG